MPELPEVETVRSGLEQAWVGRTIIEVILRRDGLRFPFPENMANVLTGAKVESVRRRAKYLLIDTNNGYVFLSHLGMSGRYVDYFIRGPYLFRTFCRTCTLEIR